MTNLYANESLYFFTKEHYEDDLKKITNESISPLISIRKVVKIAMNQYITINSSLENDVAFTQKDFSEVVKRLRRDVI